MPPTSALNMTSTILPTVPSLRLPVEWLPIQLYLEDHVQGDGISWRMTLKRMEAFKGPPPGGENFLQPSANPTNH
jgi:hypothetical protein